MKKYAILPLLLGMVMICQVARAQKVYDVTPATLQKTLKSIKPGKQDIEVRFQGGTYELKAPITITHALSKGRSIALKAAPGEKVVISGGVHVNGWQRVHGNLWKAPLNSDEKLRTLIVNGKRCRMAGAKVQQDGLGSWGEIPITGKESWAFGAGTAPKGILFAYGSEMSEFRNPQDVELVQNSVWSEKILCVEEMTKWGDTLAVTLQQPIGAVLTSLAWAGKTKFEGKFFVRNAYELLDEPGEFYFDRKGQTLYYMANNEDMTKAEVIAPQTHVLLDIEGNNLQQRVENVTVEGLTFAYDAWNLMDLEGSNGFGGIQSLAMAVKYIPDGNWHPTKYNSTTLPKGTIEISNAANINLIKNRFEHLGSAVAVNLSNDVTHTKVVGNYFNDLLGCAVSVGHPQHYEIGDGEGDIPASREGVCQDIQITDNYVRNVSLDFRQLEAMIGFFVKDVHYDHNNIAGTPYGCVALGWWWGNAKIPESTVAGNNSISYNYLGESHKILTDGGIIYMLGRQPGSVCEGNYLYKGPRCIYPDDGSSGWTIRNNFINSLRQMWLHIDSDRDYEIEIYNNYVKDNYLKNSGKGVEVKNTHVYRNIDFGEEALAIQRAAGIRKEYQQIVPATEPEPINIHIAMPIRKID